MCIDITYVHSKKKKFKEDALAHHQCSALIRAENKS